MMRRRRIYVAVVLIVFCVTLLFLAAAEARRGGGSGTVSVRGYFRKDGTYVQPHTRTAPDGNPYNNLSLCRKLRSEYRKPSRQATLRSISNAIITGRQVLPWRTFCFPCSSFVSPSTDTSATNSPSKLLGCLSSANSRRTVNRLCRRPCRSVSVKIWDVRTTRKRSKGRIKYRQSQRQEPTKSVEELERLAEEHTQQVQRGTRAIEESQCASAGSSYPAEARAFEGSNTITLIIPFYLNKPNVTAIISHEGLLVEDYCIRTRIQSIKNIESMKGDRYFRTSPT